MKFHYTLVFLLTFLTSNATINTLPLWGKTGHRVVGEIALKHLSNSAKTKLEKFLKGQSLAFVSTYADEIRSDQRYKKFGAWHYVNMKLDDTYETSKKNPKGDIITGIYHCINVIKDKNESYEDRVFYLKLLIHFIGDLHQPMHSGLSSDRGGNDIKLKWFGKDTNLHRVWDSEIINEFKMGYKELALNTDYVSKKQIEDIQKGSIIDWLNETHKITSDIYKNTTEASNLKYNYSYRYLTTVRKQLQLGGIRLAKILNELAKTL